MKNSMKIFIACCMLFFASQIQAQEYSSAVGLRFGIPTSISYKTMLGESAGLEFNLGTRGSRINTVFGRSGWRYFSLTGAYLMHNDLNIEGLEGLRWYYGGGGGLLFYTFDNDFIAVDNNVNILLQGYLGLEYTLPDTPISLTIDWVPTVVIGDYRSGFGADYGALGVRYVLN